MKWVVAIVMLVFNSCQELKKKTDIKENYRPFNAELETIIIDYQRKYPIPVEEKGQNLYIYLVSFYQKGSDTVLTLKRPADGLSSIGWDIVLGVYQDSLLLPTFIRDDSTMYSKGLINKYILDSFSRQLFSPHLGRDYSEAFPPIYHYKVKKGKFLLDKIDTVWSKW